MMTGKPILLLLALMFVFQSCFRGEGEADKPVVTVSILPQKYFVDQITAGAVNVNVLIPPGASPASYEPTPRQMQDLSASSLYIKVGYLGFEKSWGNKITANHPEMKVISLSDGLEMIEEEHHGVDPHIWMSPATVRNFLPALYAGLLEAFPEEAGSWEPNYRSLLARVDSIHQAMESSFGKLESRKFLIFHPALTYLARDYGLEQYSLEEEGKEPSVQGLRYLVDLAGKENIRVVFIQDEFDQENASTLAKEINGRVQVISPLSPDWEKNMENIRQTLVSVLTEQKPAL